LPASLRQFATPGMIIGAIARKPSCYSDRRFAARAREGKVARADSVSNRGLMPMVSQGHSPNPRKVMSSIRRRRRPLPAAGVKGLFMDSSFWSNQRTDALRGKRNARIVGVCLVGMGDRNDEIGEALAVLMALSE
jgi:hypothetical protein